MKRTTLSNQKVGKHSPAFEQSPDTSLAIHSDKAADLPDSHLVDLKSSGSIDTGNLNILRREEFLREAHARPATENDYKEWLDLYVANGGKITHPRDRNFPRHSGHRDQYHIHNDWWVVQNPNAIPNVEKLYGATSLNLIIPAGMHDFTYAFFNAKQFTLDNQDHPSVEAMRNKEREERHDSDSLTRRARIPFLLDSREGWELGHTSIYMFEQVDADGRLVAKPYTNNPGVVESFTDVTPNRRQQIGSRRGIGRSAASEHRRSLER